MDHPTRLGPDALRWRYDESTLDFESTADVRPAEGVVGQPVAIEAMRFGVECDAPGQNIYVRGLTGTGRMTLVQAVLDELKPRARRRLDRCYVHNFRQPDRPRLITLPAGDGPKLRRMIRQAAEFVEHRLAEALDSPASQARSEAIQEETQKAVAAITAPLEEELHEQDLTLVQLQTGQVTRAAIFPLVDGKPMPPDEYMKKVQSGEIDAEQQKAIEEKIVTYSKRLEAVQNQATQVFRQGVENAQAFIEKEIRSVLADITKPIREGFDVPALHCFLDEMTNDVVENRTPGAVAENLPEATVIYGVNVVCSHPESGESPVVTENAPTMANLLGTVEPDFVAGGQVASNYRGVRAGALVHADGGYLVLDARDVLTEPGAWRMLMRALRTSSVEIVPAELGWPLTTQSLKPEPIDISVRVILLGSSNLYYQLDQVDQDFSDLFKVLADFDSEIVRDDEGVRQYAGVIANMCEAEGLLAFTPGAVAAMAEHGARIAARGGRITARFGRIADITREAAFIAAKDGDEVVTREHVERTVARTRYRASLPSQKFQQMIGNGTIRLMLDGLEVGQINGLAVIHAGPLAYGFPARLTATVGAGRAGVIDIEEAAALSGSIHTKGFHILGGLLRNVLRTDHPLAFSASIAFEQSYGGIDGDSASGAEFCCLISALTGVPIRQNLAMTGAIDQMGHIQAIGGVNEKVDGFFDACRSRGLTGEQGVIIPTANAPDLMLRQDVVDACAEGRFHVYAVEDVGEALEVLTGMQAGACDSEGRFPEGSLFALAKARATEFFRKSSGKMAE